MAAAQGTYNPLLSKKMPREYKRQLSKDDIGNQARVLLNHFIHDRISREQGEEQVPSTEELQEPGTPTGPPLEHIQEIGRALRCIGDELDKNENIQSLCSQVSPEATTDTFLTVAKSFFSDGVYNWGRVGSLFYFAYKMVVKALNKIALIRAIINWVVNFITDYVAPWIIERGGWEAIEEYFGTPKNQMMFVLGLGALTVVGVYMYKTWN
ncbi:BAX [Mytilus coruscus]|uniref:BAX n=1 Tax=Mytilus coruscus TaxID=42192 RepID=A0A6J7ZUH6_MYTCO|nr:BAX [Mytilus coruscus]